MPRICGPPPLALVAVVAAAVVVSVEGEEEEAVVVVVATGPPCSASKSRLFLRERATEGSMPRLDFETREAAGFTLWWRSCFHLPWPLPASAPEPEEGEEGVESARPWEGGRVVR